MFNRAFQAALSEPVPEVRETRSNSGVRTGMRLMRPERSYPVMPVATWIPVVWAFLMPSSVSALMFSMVDKRVFLSGKGGVGEGYCYRPLGTFLRASARAYAPGAACAAAD